MGAEKYGAGKVVHYIPGRTPNADSIFSQRDRGGKHERSIRLSFDIRRSSSQTFSKQRGQYWQNAGGKRDLIHHKKLFLENYRSSTQ